MIVFQEDFVEDWKCEIELNAEEVRATEGFQTQTGLVLQRRGFSRWRHLCRGEEGWGGMGRGGGV